MARRKGGRPSEDREKTAAERLLEIFEVLPGLYGEKHLFPLMPEEDAFVHRLLEGLVARKVLQRTTREDVPSFWDRAQAFVPGDAVLWPPGAGPGGGGRPPEDRGKAKHVPGRAVPSPPVAVRAAAPRLPGAPPPPCLDRRDVRIRIPGVRLIVPSPGRVRCGLPKSSEGPRG